MYDIYVYVHLYYSKNLFTYKETLLILDIRKFCFPSDSSVNSVLQVDGPFLVISDITIPVPDITISPLDFPNSILADLLALSPAPSQSILSKEAGVILLKVYPVMFLSVEAHNSAPFYPK